ncbi:MAG: Flp pilus assembly protein CpaB [Acidimicrobiales bacterium]
MHLRRLSRSPLAFWALVAVLALLTASVVGRLVGRARADASRWGSARTVAVAARGVEAGGVVRPSDVVVRTVPVAFLPDGWVGSPADVVGRTVVVPLFRGQAVVRAELAPDGLKGLAALLPPGSRAVAVPTGAASPPLHQGDVVDVLATFDPQVAGDGDPTFPVALGAPVVDVASEAATLAVTPAEATKVAFAVAHGAVSIAVTPGPGAAADAGGAAAGTAGDAVSPAAPTALPRVPLATGATTTTRPPGR